MGAAATAICCVLASACTSARDGDGTGGSGAGGLTSSGGTVSSGGAAGSAQGGAVGSGGRAGGGGSGAGGASMGGASGREDAAVKPDGGAEDAAAPDVPLARDTAVTVEVSPPGGWLHVQGNKLLDDQNRQVRMTGVNWFGFETSNQSPHGTWARDYRSMLKQIRDVGFNTVRIPWSNAILRPNAAAQSVNTSGKDPYDGTEPMNADLKDKKPIEMLDLVVQAAAELGLRLILDNHSRDPDGYMNEKLWYTTSTSEAQWIADWVDIAKRYASIPTVVAMDLDNEPHGKPTDNPKGASWGTGDPATDWNTAAEKCGNAILEVNPEVLIIVEGVEVVGTDGYWWGGNLSGVAKAPIKLSRPEKLMYSAHEYGPEVHDQPWFSAPDFPSNLHAVWEPHFDFIMKKNLGHILIGEFGIRDPKSLNGTEGVWFDTLLSSLGDTYSWTFWCWNPNSGDTGGILDNDWVTPIAWKMDTLRKHLAPPF